MGLDHEERKRKADENAAPEFFYSYILRFEDDGTFYVGSTNNPAARFTEHAVGVGAVATSGRRFAVELVHQFGSRTEAEYNEGRIKSALAKGPVNVEAMIDNFKRISMMIRPEKTLPQLRHEEDTYDRAMRKVRHYATISYGGVRSAAACGYDGREFPSTDNWPALIQQAREEEALKTVGGRYDGRPACRQCLALAP